MLDMFNQGMEMLNTMDIEGMSHFIEGLNPQQFSFLTEKVVEIHQNNPLLPGVRLGSGEVGNFLTTLTPSSLAIKQFLERTLQAFIPFVQGGAIFLASFKGSAAVFKTILGRFKEAVEDLKWVSIGVCILAALPAAIEALQNLFFS